MHSNVQTSSKLNFRITYWLVNFAQWHFLFKRETELDKKILSALLKGEDMTMYQKLFLAMVWDRVDIAEEKILATGM